MASSDSSDLLIQGDTWNAFPSLHYVLQNLACGAFQSHAAPSLKPCDIVDGAICKQLHQYYVQYATYIFYIAIYVIWL